MKLFSLSLLAMALLVQSAWAVFDSEAQSKALAGALKAYYGVEGELTVAPVNTLAPLEKAPTSVELVEVPAILGPLMQIHARCKDGETTLSEISATFKAQLRVSSFVPRRSLQRGVAFTMADFAVQPVDRLSLKQTPVEPSVNLIEYELTGPVSAGTPLTWNYLRPIPLVRKGALVDVVAQDKGLRINTRALATQDAGRGEEVLMRNTTTNKTFTAYVLNENTVQVRF